MLQCGASLSVAIRLWEPSTGTWNPTFVTRWAEPTATTATTAATATTATTATATDPLEAWLQRGSAHMKVVPHPFVGGAAAELNDDDPAALDLAGSSSDHDSDEERAGGSDEFDSDEYTATGGWSPESVAGRNGPRFEQHAAYLAEKAGDVDKFVEDMKWQEADYDADDEDWAVNPEISDEREYSGPKPHGGGLSLHWFGRNGMLKWSESEIFDSLKLFFTIVPFTWFVETAMCTDLKAERWLAKFFAAETRKWQRDSSYQRKKPREYRNIGRDVYRMVRFWGPQMWRSVSCPHSAAHYKAWGKKKHLANERDFVQLIYDSQSLTEWQQIKRFFSQIDYEDEGVKAALNPDDAAYDCTTKIAPLTNLVRERTQLLTVPSEAGAYDERTWHCYAFGPAAFLGRISGKNVTSQGFQEWAWAFHVHPEIAMSQGDLDSGVYQKGLQLTITWAFSWRVRRHGRTGNGGPTIWDPQLSPTHNQLLGVFLQLPRNRADGTTYMDNAFPNPRVLGWLKLRFGENVVGTLNLHFKKGGAVAVLALPDKNETNRKVQTLREIPPRVAHYKGCTIFAAWDQGKARMITTIHRNVFQYVDTSKARRKGLPEEYCHTRFKLLPLPDYSWEMNCVDVIDARARWRRVLLQSSKWYLYPTAMKMTDAAVLAHAIHVLLVEAFQKMHGRVTKRPPFDSDEFRSDLAKRMLAFTGAGYEDEVNGAARSPGKKKRRRKRKSDIDDNPPAPPLPAAATERRWHKLHYARASSSGEESRPKKGPGEALRVLRHEDCDSPVFRPGLRGFEPSQLNQVAGVKVQRQRRCMAVLPAAPRSHTRRREERGELQIVDRKRQQSGRLHPPEGGQRPARKERETH